MRVMTPWFTLWGTKERQMLAPKRSSSSSAFEEILISRQIQYRKTDVPGARMVQIHVADPDGNHIHIDFEETE